ncbi:PssE/Cps14G family polysaccharide biosynthesis glycosyltransferase [Murimonas intestini]|uniref:Glycosyltransferase involved in cell wall biosynthesis n=1 Tax=Murimonas intestini TaxID=1337051 RepID=A0AB73T555_9FIRM|nr:PssE/Cps14G family polysaccharide biosynthesis glycosyltransferase [Murimonas intestini]MCR1840692.1 glycosyltransferase [Murimonas intestini]MCR1865255.1 glycosyltransferase [Murimonas intestini]MCR1883019.1 glycosyltransferase [Murimonas intestini]
MIFITVGSRSFQFNRLLKAVDSAIENGEIIDNIFAQIGSSTYKVKHYKTVDFLNREEFNKKLKECDIVLTHGGTGVIVNAAKMGKRIVAIPRLEKYDEAVDNHQLQLIEAFEKLGIVTGCYDCSKIGEAITAEKKKIIKPYVSNTNIILDSIDEMIVSGCCNSIKENSGKLRILMCGSDRREKGGMNSVIDQLLNHSWGHRYQFSYLATHVSGSPVKKIVFFAKAYLKLHELIHKDTFDIIHIHMSYKGSFYRKFYVTKLCKKYNKKVIIHLHGSEFIDFFNSSGMKRKAQIKELFTIADSIIVLGEDWKKFICSLAPKANVEVINNAIALPDIAEKTIGKRRTLLFLGALIKRKGVCDLLKAIKNITEEGIINFQLLIAGAGEEETKLKDFVRINKLEDQVKFLGWITKAQKPEILKSSDVLVLPSYNEGLPIAILEAMSYGLPIISTKVGCIAEAVIDNGFLIDPGNVELLTDYLKLLIADDNLLLEMSYCSRYLAETKFSEKIFYEKIERLYRKLGE